VWERWIIGLMDCWINGLMVPSNPLIHHSNNPARQHAITPKLQQSITPFSEEANRAEQNVFQQKRSSGDTMDLGCFRGGSGNGDDAHNRDYRRGGWQHFEQ
jgi:hypothetical protein